MLKASHTILFLSAALAAFAPRAAAGEGSTEASLLRVISLQQAQIDEQSRTLAELRGAIESLASEVRSQYLKASDAAATYVTKDTASGYVTRAAADAAYVAKSDGSYVTKAFASATYASIAAHDALAAKVAPIDCRNNDGHNNRVCNFHSPIYVHFNNSTLYLPESWTRRPSLYRNGQHIWNTP